MFSNTKVIKLIFLKKLPNRLICVLLGFVFVPTLLAHDLINRISFGEGEEGNGGSFSPSISIDGRFTAFHSEANNLVPNDSNSYNDIFVYDRQTQQLKRVNISSQGDESNFESYYPSISADGRYIAFQSDASNLVPNDTNSATDIFVHDQITGITQRVSINSQGEQGDRHSSEPAISGDGRYVVFHSQASNLVAKDTNEGIDVFLHDLQTQETTLVNLNAKGKQGRGISFGPVISEDGRYIAFASSVSNLVEEDTNELVDVFVFDRQTKQTTRVSVNSEGQQADGVSFRPTLSADGQYVAFRSQATNLVANDTNGEEDIFVHDRATGTTTRISVDSQGQEANGRSFNATISGNGQFVVFNSDANNLVADDQNSNTDVFVHNRETGQTYRLTHDSESYSHVPASYYSPVISKDGRWIAFESKAWNLAANDFNEAADVFLYDREYYANFEVATGKLHIIALKVPEAGLFWASLYLIPNSNPLQFTLKRSGPLDLLLADDIITSYTLETGVLYLPKVEVMNPPQAIFTCQAEMTSDSTLTTFTVTQVNCNEP